MWALIVGQIRRWRWPAMLLLTGLAAVASLSARASAQRDAALAQAPGAIQQLRLDVQAHRPGSERDLRQLADYGHPLAARTLAELAAVDATPQAQQVALDWYRRGAEAGDAESAYRLGLAYLQGRTLPSDPVQARRWFERAGALPAARFRLATLLLRGEGGVANAAQGLQWLAQAATDGDADAMFALANRYRDGEGLPRDEMQALRWYRAAANGEHPAALQTLSLAYARGELGLPVDPDQAQFLGEYAGHAAKCHTPHARVALF
ncbi:tetratricopeptide repeat protein [Jeongeupia sp. USM3]|uniref:tetratricopeptide repeat protein n=1 Tax=Jeongeupia sp. USM3 TaxID=1906741 RepID=UPI00089E0567|nr:tetratricopeptide repeat protein [Jeongeupia sp. USM3]AOY01958.1 hypothetical protein BJP62_16835 [Jeongeupia sp. USM3]